MQLQPWNSSGPLFPTLAVFTNRGVFHSKRSGMLYKFGLPNKMLMLSPYCNDEINCHVISLSAGFAYPFLNDLTIRNHII
jgi:hypothetical protein